MKRLIRYQSFCIFGICLLWIGACTVSRPGPVSAPERLSGYKVLGRWYYPLKTADGYSARGMASWYGPDFHGKKTANGEKYDMHAFTAAHTTLPLGTRVRVTNLDNGKEVIVKINDRGPFVKRRIIDLSYAAAKSIGIVSKGTGRVELTALPPLTSGKGYALQVGSFSTRSNAESLIQTLSRQHEHVNLLAENGMYKVHLGRFSTRDAAEKVKIELSYSGYQAFTVEIP